VPFSLFLLLNPKTMEVAEIINPEIISTEGNQMFNEGCLSAPGIFVQTKRPQSVHFKYQTRTGEQKEGVVEGVEAVSFMHEYGHLQGEMFLVHTTRQQRNYALRKMGMK